MTKITSKYFRNMTETMDKRILTHFSELEPPADIDLPTSNIKWLYPHKNIETRRCTEAFYSKFYADTHERIMVIGINPGRFGSGITGVPLTDPIRLKSACHIDSNFAMKPELSSQFIYDHFFVRYSMEEFFANFYIGAVCPLGLERNGRNMNYYDDKHFMNELLEHFIPDNLREQIDLGCTRKVAICLGEGTNFDVLEKLNRKHNFFDRILKVSHPRYIMQYKRKLIDNYVQQYVDACQLAREFLNEK